MKHPHPTHTARDVHLYGGADTYTFDGSFGQDSVKDADGQGRIQINGQTLGKFSAAGERNTYSAKRGDGSSIQNFNLGKAQGGSGYLGIRLDGKQKVASQTCMRHKASKFIAVHAFK